MLNQAIINSSAFLGNIVDLDISDLDFKALDHHATILGVAKDGEAWHLIAEVQNFRRLERGVKKLISIGASRMACNIREADAMIRTFTSDIPVSLVDSTNRQFIKEASMLLPCDEMEDDFAHYQLETRESELVSQVEHASIANSNIQEANKAYNLTSMPLISISGIKRDHLISIANTFIEYTSNPVSKTLIDESEMSKYLELYADKSFDEALKYLYVTFTPYKVLDKELKSIASKARGTLSIKDDMEIAQKKGKYFFSIKSNSGIDTIHNLYESIQHLMNALPAISFVYKLEEAQDLYNEMNNFFMEKGGVYSFEAVNSRDKINFLGINMTVFKSKIELSMSDDVFRMFETFIIEHE